MSAARPRCHACGWTPTSPMNAAQHHLFCPGRPGGGVVLSSLPGGTSPRAAGNPTP